MGKNRKVFILKTLIEVFDPAIFAILFLWRPYPPQITRFFGLNTTFSAVGGVTAESRTGKYTVTVYAEKETSRKKRLMVGPFRDFPQCSYLIPTKEALFWVDDSGENCIVSPEWISIKENALGAAAEITEPFKNLCQDYRVQRKNGMVVYSLNGPGKTPLLRFSIPETWY